MICDFDDAWPGHVKADRLNRLKELNPAFKLTLFCVPGRCSREWLEALPDWVEAVPHGWMHETSLECLHWTRERMLQNLEDCLALGFTVRGWKSPGWQTSDGVYQALVETGWWIADQHLEDERRPAELRTYFYEDGPERWHGHIQDVCGNGIEETWPALVEAVTSAESFRFCSEALS